MPTCEKCHRDVDATLNLNISGKLNLRGWKNKKTAKFCFSCVREYAKSCLDPKGYWYPILFPQEIPLKNRKQY